VVIGPPPLVDAPPAELVETLEELVEGALPDVVEVEAPVPVVLEDPVPAVLDGGEPPGPDLLAVSALSEQAMQTRAQAQMQRALKRDFVMSA
jgi:hypothetical protein